MIRAYAEVCINVSDVRAKIITYGNKMQTAVKESRWFRISDVNGLELKYFSAYIRYLRCVLHLMFIPG